MHLAAVVERVMHARGASGAVIIAGSGNNGGDGFAAARHLANAGVPVRIIMPLGLPRSGGDAAINLEITRRMGLPLEISNSADTLKDTLADIEPRDVIVDALFGTGLDRPLTDRTAEIVIRINERREAGSPVVAADIPSGLDGDTGEVLGTAVMADVTVTFAGVKPGLLRCAGQVGELWLAGIGVPSSLLHRLGSPASGVRVSSGMPG